MKLLLIMSLFFSADINEKIDRLLERYDTNNDQSIDKAEAGPKMWRRIGNADLNRDGKVTRTEMLEKWG